ncbi:E3 ubiquitin-protein ligase TRIM35-like [Syngnathoides biaculeatus]|uniref:E3 ubiquitin-protein ligase TRIM35-like n=1 Tax=Syngnathoides biaculeatus TaxID=300417 RepID=UPI002ADDFEA3|nr:E3 ubiquitin-protein ligase TRIM35-like [Syngnathoides biaculeatus]
MASQAKEHLCCPTCLDIFKDPVMLPCSHNVCRACLQQRRKEEGDRSCPVCKKRCNSIDIHPNLTLRNLCEDFSQALVKPKEICRLHDEKLKLFCLDHQESICLVCRDAKIHAGHKFCPLDEVPQYHKEELQKALQDAKKRCDDYTTTRDNCTEQEEYIKVQRNQVESKIRQDFAELHHFLHVEEEKRLSALREEEQKKRQIMKEKIEALNRDMTALSDMIRTTEEMTSDHDSLMKNFRDVITRIQLLPDEPELLPGALLDEVKHVGNLKFTVLEQMREMVSYSPVILDPNTAIQTLRLSEDLTSVSSKVGGQRPNNPERLNWNAVLGSALDSETHTWDVEVGDNKDWRLGIAWGDSPVNITSWIIGCRDGKYKMKGPYGSWNPPVKLERIQIRVDMNERSVSFFESTTNTKLDIKSPSTWPQLSGNKKMYPYFYTKDQSPLKITPLSVCVMTQNQ